MNGKGVLRLVKSLTVRQEADGGGEVWEIEKILVNWLGERFGKSYSIRASRDVDVVFVLLTPDDVGFASFKPKSKRKWPGMNVVFELGYFLGVMRRRTGRVLVLLKGRLELPSDLAGVVYIGITNGVEAAAPLI